MPSIKTVYPDGQGAGKFLWGENDNNKSNEQILLAITAVPLPDGTVLGRYTSGGNLGQYAPLDPAQSDGRQTFAGILLGDAPISTTTQRATIVVREQVVIANFLNYVNSVTTNQRLAVEAAMTAAMIIPRR